MERNRFSIQIMFLYNFPRLLFHKRAHLFSYLHVFSQYSKANDTVCKWSEKLIKLLIPTTLFVAMAHIP